MCFGVTNPLAVVMWGEGLRVGVIVFEPIHDDSPEPLGLGATIRSVSALHEGKVLACFAMDQG